MADTTLRSDSALSKRADETSQQHADRLLEAHRAAADAELEPARHPRSSLDRVENASCDVSVALALSASIADIVDNVFRLVSHKGVAPDTNLKMLAGRAVTLLCNQQEILTRAEKRLDKAARTMVVE